MAAPASDEVIQAQLQAAKASGKLAGQAEALFALAHSARRRGDRVLAVDYYQQAGMIWQQLKSWPNMLSTLNNLAALYSDLDDNDAAYKSARAATELAQRLGDNRALAMAVNTLGGVANNTGDTETARTAYAKSLELSQAEGDRMRSARAFYNLSWVAFISGDYADARGRSLEAATALGDAVDPATQAYISMIAGRLDLRQHVNDRAQARLGWAARTFHYAGEDEPAALASFAFGCAEYLAGDRDGGRRRIEATFEGIRLNRNRRVTAERLVGLSRLAAEAGAADDAQAFGQLALNIGTHLSDPDVEGRARQLLSGGTYAGAADAGIATAAAELDFHHAAAEVAEAPGAGDGADLSWQEHDFGVVPLTVASPAAAPGAPGSEYIGPVGVLDLTAEGHGYSIHQDVAHDIGVANNADAEAALNVVLQRRDPRLSERLEFETDAGGLGIRSLSHDDIRAAAAWLGSMFKSAERATE